MILPVMAFTMTFQQWFTAPPGPSDTIGGSGKLARPYKIPTIFSEPVAGGGGRLREMTAHGYWGRFNSCPLKAMG